MVFKKKILISTALTAVLITSPVAYSKDVNHYSLGLQAEFSGDTQEALDQYTIAAEKGLPDAKFALGRLYRDVFADYEHSIKWFEAAAEQGNVYAQYELGQLYRNGTSSEEDLMLAIKWFTHAAEGGKHGEAAYALFELTESDQDKLRWLQQAANQGVTQAMHRLGEAYNNGELGLSVDTTLAQYWFKQAANSQE